MNESQFRSDWTKGLLPFLVMSAISSHQNHGYAIAQQLSASGIGPIKGGALYPVLNRLEAEGIVSGTWSAGDNGPGRKTFLLTTAGHEQLAHQAKQWAEFASTVHRFTDITPEGR